MPWLPEYPPGLTPAAAQAAYRYQVEPVHVGHVPNRGEQIAKILQGVGQNIRDYVQQRESDEIANALLQEYGAPEGVQGQVGLEMYLKGQQAKSMIDYRQAMEARMNARSNGGGGNGSSGNGSTPRVDESTGLIWNGRQWIKPPAGSNVNPLASLDSDVRKQAGVGADALMAAMTPGSQGGQGGIYVEKGADGKEIMMFRPQGGAPVQVDPDKFLPQVNKATELMRQRSPAKLTPQTTETDGTLGGAGTYRDGAETAPKPNESVNSDKGSQGGYIKGRRYAGRTYMGGDPHDERNWR